VNTGKYVGKRNLEDTIAKINVEAAKEIVRQIRLRDLGGIIIIDFIDMEKEENKQHVFQALHEELKKDRSKSSILPLSELGLVQMTRKRVKRSLGDTLCRPCPYCYGRGHIKSIRTIIAEIQREVMKLGDIGEEKELLMRVHPQVAAFLRREDRSLIQEIENMTGATVTIRSDESLHHEQFDILPL
jgi:ribonuclease G